VPALRLIQ